MGTEIEQHTSQFSALVWSACVRACVRVRVHVRGGVLHRYVLQHVRFWRNTWSGAVAWRRGGIRGTGNKIAAPKGHRIGQEGRFLGVISQAYITEVPESAPETPVIFISLTF